MRYWSLWAVGSAIETNVVIHDTKIYPQAYQSKAHFLSFAMSDVGFQQS